MGGLPVLSGAVQLTLRLVVEAAVTVTFVGGSGGSATSVTFTVTVTLSAPPFPSLAVTVTVYCACASWSSTAAVANWPESMLKESASVPPPTLQVMVSPASASMASKASPTAVPTDLFSSTARVTESAPVITGAELPGVAVASTQSLLPTLFFARTRTV